MIYLSLFEMALSNDVPSGIMFLYSLTSIMCLLIGRSAIEILTFMVSKISLHSGTTAISSVSGGKRETE